jgi:hypothetical protein
MIAYEGSVKLSKALDCNALQCIAMHCPYFINGGTMHCDAWLSKPLYTIKGGKRHSLGVFEIGEFENLGNFPHKDDYFGHLPAIPQCFG